MIKKILLLLVIVLGFESKAQVGVNTTDPKAQLDIRSTNQVTPSNTDGLLIPKINAFPVTNPTVDQQGMLVYLTTTVGANTPGFYYWNNPTTAWLPVKGTDGGTLDQAYDFGGAGIGRTITADTGAVTIDGTDGLVSTGTSGSGAFAPSGAGTRMVWNPRKAAFRAGSTGVTQWDDANIGTNSVAFGNSSTSSGATSTAFGNFSNASGGASTAFGDNTNASGFVSTAFGQSTTASGTRSTAFGFVNSALGSQSTVFGLFNTSASLGETVIGIGATTYTPSTNGDTKFIPANATDRLFVIGNAIDLNNSNFVDASERSDAMVVLKNGLTRLPSTTNTLIDAADGKTIVTKEWVQQNSSGTLDQAYDFGGAGNGRTIIADTGAVTIAGTDGLVSTGTQGSGALAPSGAGTRMVWNPRKAAFRVGTVSGTLWDDASIGNGSVAFGNSIAIGGNSFAAAGGNASGTSSIAYGLGATATGQSSFAFGQGASVSGGSQDAIAMGINSQASAVRAIALGASNVANGFGSLAIGSSNTSSGSQAVALGNLNTAAGTNSMALGTNNTSSSFGETVLGIGATTYTPSVNGATQFRTANATDRLFVVGNAIDANNNNTVDVSERSDALMVLKNGNVGVGISTPQNKLHFHNPTGFETFMQLTNATTGTTVTDGMIIGNIVATGEAGIINLESENLYFGTSGNSDNLVITPTGNVGIGTTGANERLEVQGKIRMVDGNQAAGKVLISDANGTATWTTPGAGTAGTLDQSYDFGGAGNGRTITADTGAVTIAGTDGLVSTGTNGSGSLAPSGSGTKMFWNPRKTAFRAGFVGGSQWDDASIGNVSFAFGENTIANGIWATAIGKENTSSGNASFTSGRQNTAFSFGEFVLGVGATEYTPSVGGSASFRTTNATDRLFVVGNAIDANSNNTVDAAERSDAMVVLKNGNTGIGVSTPGERLQVAGRSLFTNGFSADNAALIYRNNTDYMFLGPQSGSSANGGAVALFGSTNVSGGNAGGIDLNVLNGQLRLTSAGSVGIGATVPARKLEVSNAGIVYGRITNTATTEVGFELKRSGSDWQMRNETGLLFFGQSNDDLVTVTDVLRLGGGSVTPAVDNGVTLGQLALRWTNVFAVNGTIQTSDANDKKEMKSLSFGLDKIKQLRPISFQWKDNAIDNSATHLGFVAQEVQQVLPEVIVDSDWVELPEGQGRIWQKSERLGMKYAEIIPVLVKAVQEQQEVIENQKTEIASLKQQLEQQNKAILERLQKLEAKN